MAILLIIGGTGFFGKSILDCYKKGLLSEWDIDKVIIMSRNTDNFKQNYPELLSNNLEFLNGDIATIDYLPEADFVIHAAASTDASRYLSHNEEEKQNIILGTLNYCRLAPKFHKHSKIIFCSSGAVYGYQANDVEFLTEEMAFGNIDKLDEVKKSYAYAKRDSEQAFQELGKQDLNVSIARCFAFVGKYLPKDQHFAIGNFIADGLAGRDIEVKATKKVYRSYMYADDLVRWLMTIADNSNSKCPVYNVGSNMAIEIRELADIISKCFNVNLSLSNKISKNIDKYIPSINQATKDLGLSLQTNLSEMITLSSNMKKA